MKTYGVTVDQLQIDDIVRRIDGSFGEELPFSGRALTENDIEVLQRIFGDGGFQDYLDDQANRQIIRVYLTNAIILGFPQVSAGKSHVVHLPLVRVKSEIRDAA